MKQRDLLKGRVKRMLREQKDMGQVAEPAVLCCVSAIQEFVRDLARKMQAQTTAGTGNGLTPIELKKAVLASEDLQFLHEKVAAIDESAAKYHKPARGKKRSAAASVAAKSGASKKKLRTTAAKARPADERRIQDLATASPKDQDQDGDTSAGRKAAASLEVEEDEDYDESDSE